MHDMKHKSMEKFGDICELKHQILKFIDSQTASGLTFDPTEVAVMGEYVDMIKDLAEAEKYCQEACYYESVVEAMDEYGDNPRMGYNPNRNAKGQYTSRGGYSDMDSDGRSSGSSRGMNRSQSGNRRSGYMPDPDMYGRYDMRMDDPHMDDSDWDDRYGRPFNEFRKAKRHYTQTHSAEDKEKMKEHANEHMMESMTTIREIYDNADPDLKKRMKSDLTKLASEMTV